MWKLLLPSPSRAHVADVLPPWTVLPEALFAPLTLAVVTQVPSLGTRGRKRPRPWQPGRLLSLPLPSIHPSFFVSSLFFFFPSLLVGAFCLSLLILFVAKRAGGGVPVWSASYSPPTFSSVLSASSKERGREERRPSRCRHCCRRCRRLCHPGNVHTPPNQTSGHSGKLC